MTITTYPTRNEYTSTAGQSLFSYTFKVFASTDLRAFVTPAGQVADDSADEVFGFAVTGVGDEGGGTITLVVAASLGDKVTIIGAIPSSRETDYQYSGDFVPETVNNDFDRILSLTKQVEDLANRVLSFEKAQQGATGLTLPAPSSLQFLQWKSDLSGIQNSESTIVPQLTYDASIVYPLNFPVVGGDGLPYISLAINGPGTVVGVVNPVGDVTGTWYLIGNKIIDADKDTYITCEETPDEDLIKAYIAGLQVAEFDASGLLINGNRALEGAAYSTPCVLRRVLVTISDGTAANSLKCQVYNWYNGDEFPETDDIVKGAVTGDFTLQVDGKNFFLNSTSLSGNCLAVLSVEGEDSSGNNYHYGAIPFVQAIAMFCITPGDMNTGVDFTTVVDLGDISIYITYITDA